MKLQPQIKSDISKVMVISIAFVLINGYMTFFTESVISAFSLGPNENYVPDENLLLSSIIGLIAGISGGWVLVFVNNRLFRKKSYNYALKVTFLAYTIVFLFIMFINAFLSSRIKLGPEAGFTELYVGASPYMFGRMTTVFYIFWGIVTMVTLFFLQVYDKFGTGMFLKFLTGKYHQPREEERIFMFLDMKSSTTIAEKIGNKKYFNLLNDLFTDITDPILPVKGKSINMWVMKWWFPGN